MECSDGLLAEMSRAKVLVTGFGPFEGVQENPSGLIAKALHDGLNIVGVELPVSYRRSLIDLHEVLAQCKSPSLLIGLGVHGEAGFRFEKQAGTVFHDYPDIDGESGLIFCKATDVLVSRLDLASFAAALAKNTQTKAWLSEDAGGYLCEWVYRQLLEQADALACEAFFIHVPPLEFTPLTEQVLVIQSMIQKALEQTQFVLPEKSLPS